MNYTSSSDGMQRIKTARDSKQWTVTDNPDILIAASYWVIENYQKEKGYQDYDLRWIKALDKLFHTNRKSDQKYQENLEKLRQELVFCNRNKQDVKEAIKTFIYYEDFYVTGISYGTWKRFNQGKKVNERAFKAYCGILGLEWQQILNFQTIDLGDSPNLRVFYGREKELKNLQQHIIIEKCRFIKIIGIGGMGKTALSVKFVQKFSHHFDIIIWRSLRNKKPFHTLLEEWLKIISQQENIGEIEDSEQGINQLMVYLQQKRCLLILDNLESILQPKPENNDYQEGYQDYGQLFQRIIQDNHHQSCLLLTSREQPQELSQFSENENFIYSLRLEGLDSKNMKKLIDKKGFFQGETNHEEWERVNQYYSGNPLALQLVGANLQYLEYKTLSDFVQQIEDDSQLLFDNIIDLIDSQFKELSSLEQEIMYWLAIEREPITVNQLKSNLLNPSDKLKIDKALLRIARRCLLDKSKGRFSLQNVILDYVTQTLLEKMIQELRENRFELFDQYSLVKGNAKEYIREMQNLTLLQPIAEQLNQREIKEYYFEYSKNDQSNPFRIHINQPWEQLKTLSGYAGSNLMSLLAYWRQGDLSRGNFSDLTFNYGYFQGLKLQNTDFTNATFNHCTFSQTFGSITSLAFHPHLMQLATGDYHGTIYLWDIEQREPLVKLTAHQTWCWSLAFSQDGKLLASGGKNGEIKLWSLDDHQYQFICEYNEHQLAVRSLTFNSDHTLLASGSEDHKIKIWDLQKEKCLHTLVGHQRPIGGVKFSPDGEILASASADGFIKLWDVKEGQLIRNLSPDSGWMWSVDFNLDGTLLASGGGDGKLRVWDINSGECLQELEGHSSYIWSVAFSPDGEIIATGSEDNTIRLWSVQEKRCLSTLTGFKNSIWSISFSSDGKTVAGGCVDRSVKVYSLENYQCLQTLQGYSNGVLSLVFTPDGKELMGKVADNSIQVWSVKTGKLKTSLESENYELVTGKIALNTHYNCLLSIGDETTIDLWDIKQKKWLTALNEHSKKVWSISCNDEGSLLVSGSGDNTLKLWSMDSYQCLQTLEGHSAWVLATAFSPDGKYIVSGSEDTNVKIWKKDTKEKWQCIHTLTDHQGRIWTVAFSPDGHYFASGSDDKTIRIWELKTGNCVKVLEGHDDWVWSVHFSPDDQSLASGSDDRTVKLWDIKTGDCIKTFNHEKGVRAIAFSPDGKTLASGSDDETIKLWNMETKQEVKTLQVLRLYEGMKLDGVKGLSEETRDILGLLGAN